MRERIALRPCPHCGGEAEFRIFTGKAGWISCKKCGCQTPFLKREEAIKRWNARPEDYNNE